jgi:hypothetical protein
MSPRFTPTAADEATADAMMRPDYEWTLWWSVFGWLRAFC